MKRRYSVAGTNLSSSKSRVSSRRSIDAVCDEMVLTPSSNPGQQPKAYSRRDLSARTKPSGGRVKLSITGGEDRQMNCRLNETSGDR
jgi:hypothetical protein